jgi:cysteine desulfurase family protein
MAEQPGEIIYLNNAATSYPKAPGVEPAMVRALRGWGLTPGRASPAGEDGAARTIYQARSALARLLGAPDPARLIFTMNATDSLNLALTGLLRDGGHVVTTSMEHNSVARPLRHLAERGVTITRVPCDGAGRLDPAEIAAALRPETQLIVLTHASNVTGTLMPVAEVVAIARQRTIPVLVDAAQTAGCAAMDLGGLGADYVAFTGHKALLGPPGVGVLYVGDTQRLAPMRVGGTGSQSEHDRQPEALPDRYEAGTPNVVGIAGLGAAAEFLLERGVAEVRRHERALVARLLGRLGEIPSVVVYGPRDADQVAGIVSFNIGDLDCAEVARVLESEHGIITRCGLHCAPWAHETIGTLERGTVRASVGWATTEAEVDALAEAVAAVSSASGAR